MAEWTETKNGWLLSNRRGEVELEIWLWESDGSWWMLAYQDSHCLIPGRNLATPDLETAKTMAPLVVRHHVGLLWEMTI